ncbi:MAG: hypothetical protein M3Y23_05560 [Actinomycetota bacterium]|nr:hypothetical protein [Actinomycetota bacterium]
MNKRLLTLLAALLSAGALVAAGCGGDDDSSSDEPAPTQAAYIEEADAICAEDQTELQEITADLPNDIEAPESQAAISDEILPLYQDQVGELRDITPPEGDEDTTAAIYDSVEEALAKIEEDPSALGDAATFEEANTLATDYGLTVCGS